jgi:hypothetical protein
MLKDFSFDYIYYRLNRFYFRWDGRNGITAVIGVSMIQCLIIFDFVLLIQRIFYSRDLIVSFGISKAMPYLAVALMLMILNYFKYLDKYNKFRSRWKNESGNDQISRGILVIICLVAPWMPLILLGLRGS